MKCQQCGCGLIDMVHHNVELIDGRLQGPYCWDCFQEADAEYDEWLTHHCLKHTTDELEEY